MAKEFSFDSLINNNFGVIEITLKEFMDKNGINRNSLARACGANYPVIDRLYKAKHVDRLDTEILAKICHVCQCDLSEIIQYKPYAQSK